MSSPLPFPRWFSSLALTLATYSPGSSIYNFPSPPTAPRMQTVPSDVSSRRPSSALSFMRPEAYGDTTESQRVQDAQRREIQTLWKQLTESELSRASERSEIESLRQEVAALKTAGPPTPATSQEKAMILVWEERCREARKGMEEAREDARAAREETSRIERDAEVRVESLRAQLDGIRSLLGGKM